MNFLPRYGFQGSSEGLEDWKSASNKFNIDPEVTALLDKVNAFRIQGTMKEKKQPRMTHERAVTLQQELLEGFSSEEFQDQLKKLKQDGKDKAAQLREYRQLALTVQ